MKVIFITVSESSVANNLLRGDFFRLLRSVSGLRIVLLAPPAAASVYVREFAGKNVTVEAIAPMRLIFRERANNFLARNVLRTRMVHLLQARQFLDDRKRSPYALKRILATFFGRSRIFQSIVRLHERTLPNSASVRALFDRYSPDFLFASIANCIEMDVPLLREAKRRGIKTFGMMRGWDAFPAHGFLRVIPDMLLLQNEYMRATGRKYQFIPEDRMRVIGTPSFDWHFRKDFLKSREEFCREIGTNPQKKIILFGAMEYYWYPRDADIARIFDEFAASGKIPKDTVMLFRPYPGYEGPIERIKGLAHVIPDMASFTRVQGDNMQMRERHMSHLVNSLFHSSIVVSVASTIALDGVGFDKPAISIAFEESSHSYWESIDRFHTHNTHFMDVFKIDAIPEVRSREEFAARVNEYLRNPEKDEEKRKLLRRIFLEPYDGKAGERIYQEMCRALETHG